MRRFIVWFILATLVSGAAGFLLPGVNSDGKLATIALLGFLLAVGEVVLTVVEGGVAVLLFFLPRFIRRLLLRSLAVGIAASLVSGFAFGSPLFVGIAGFTVLLSLAYLLPFAQ